MRTIFTAISTLVLLICSYGEKTTTLAESVMAIIENATDKELYPRLVYADGSSRTPSVDYPPVRSKSNTQILIKRDRPWSLFFATGCTLDSSGHLVNCITGNCGEGRCTFGDQPVATMISYDSGTMKTTTENGYNCGLDGVFLCVGCDCPSFSCVIPLNRCPENLRVYDNSRSLVACKPGDGLPSGEDCPAPGSYSGPPSTGAACPFKNAILKITVRSPC